MQEARFGITGEEGVKRKRPVTGVAPVTGRPIPNIAALTRTFGPHPGTGCLPRDNTACNNRSGGYGLSCGGLYRWTVRASNAPFWRLICRMPVASQRWPTMDIAAHLRSV